MALTEQVIFDIQSAQRQIDSLERQLDGLGTPIDVPVNIDEQDFEKVARALGVSEEEARQLATTVGRSVTEATQLDSELRDVARALGLSEREAADFAREMRRVESATDQTTRGILRFGSRGASVFTNLRGSLLGVIGAFGLFQAARGFVSFAQDSIDAASDLEESTSKVSVVFGQFADDIEEFASTAPQALGLADAAALEFAGTFGNLFVALGLTQQAAADLAPDIVQLGADLASFNNIETTEALDKLRAGLVGEAEPLRQLGVNLTAATTEAKALELGFGGLTGELTEAEKVQARYALIVEQTATAQGDFARTSDSIANRQRTLSAEFANTRAIVGEALLPAFEQLLDIAPQLISLIEDGLVPAITTMSSAFGDVDASAFIEVLANLPIAVERSVNVLGPAAQALGNFFQAGSELVTLDFRGTFDQLSQGLDDISDARISNQIGQSIQDLITTIVGGAEPVLALESSLAGLADIDLPDDEFGDLAERLLQISGASDPTELFELRQRILELGEASGFSETQVDAMARVLLGPWAQAMAEASAGDIIAGNLAGTLGELGDAAAGVGPDLEALGEDLDFSDQISRLNAQFGSLPDGLDAAAAALRDDENEIISDFTTFLDNLEGELQARQVFADNIALLRALGLDDLAAVFEEAGLDAAEALQDAIANIGEARQAEALLEDAAQSQADAYVRSFEQSISSEPITQALIDEIIEAAGAANTPEVQAALEALAQALAITIPVELGEIPDTPGTRAARERGFPVDENAPVSPRGDVNVTQNFEGFTPSTPDLTRAAQAVNQVTQS